MKMTTLFSVSTAVVLTVLAAPLEAEPFTIVDVAGRSVSFEQPAERIILGEARVIYTLAVLDRENPFARVVAWRNDLLTNNGYAYDLYTDAWPQAKDLPFIGRLGDGTLQIEAIADLKPDVFLLPIGERNAAEEIGLEGLLDGIGVKLVFLDFREQLFNTVPSIEALGRITGQTERAEAFAGYWQAQMDRVTEAIEAADPERPDVFMYRAGGLIECCGTFGPENFGRMVEMAGGHNLGSDFLPGYSGTINPEQVVASDPDVIVVTGGNWTHRDGAGEDDAYVRVGPGAAADADAARAALNALMAQPSFAESAAVAGGDVHAIWHQFYASPYQFAAVQRLATWFQPELFADLDPDATFAGFHAEFMPAELPYEPGFWLDATAD